MSAVRLLRRSQQAAGNFVDRQLPSASADTAASSLPRAVPLNLKVIASSGLSSCQVQVNSPSQGYGRKANWLTWSRLTSAIRPGLKKGDPISRPRQLTFWQVVRSPYGSQMPLTWLTDTENCQLYVGRCIVRHGEDAVCLDIPNSRLPAIPALGVGPFECRDHVVH